MRLIGRLFTHIAVRYLPDAFVFLFFLTLAVLGLGIFWGDGHEPRQVLDYWGNGFFSIYEFTCQIILVLVSGYALAHTRPVRRALIKLTHLPRTEVQVIVATTLIAMLCSWISWGFGLVAGGLVAREMGIVHRGRVHYPLVVAAAYSGFIVWHGGYGGSIPTVIANPGHFLEAEMGIIPVSQTVFSIGNLAILAAMVLVVPAVLVSMRPRADEPRTSLPEGEQSDDMTTAPLPERSHMTPALRLEYSRLIPLTLGVIALLWLADHFITGGGVNINTVILGFFALGLLFSRHTREYITFCTGGSRTAYGIIMQFPFYAAMMGVISGTGMATDIGSALVSIASSESLPFYSFLSAGLINFFIPAGGGQWIMQGPIVIDAARQLDADMANVAMAVAWGDAWTNMVQPFWTLPLLAIAGLQIRDIMGYTSVIMLVTGVVLGVAMFLI
ncbi:short-chain fatty acid transporter [Kushneria konosiri]|uniref:Short-chain fatty acid transporter n=1 Tax=Kushneria konosiri TaxID=698828 RepID=A0A2Z2H510_9GAMM|nr:TIGR00366 family protein [Kushneria konosiri]ARS52318.1 hypothetical protein B9G99_05005 [Kushneria konosiri]